MSFQIQIFHVPDDGRVLHSTGGHSEKCIRKQGSRPTGAARRVDKMPEQKEFIMDKVDQGSILTGPEMWEEIQKHVNCGNENVVGMDRTQVRAAFVVTAQSFPFSHYDYPPNQCIKYLSNLRNRDSVKVGELDHLVAANMGSSYVATCRWNNVFTHPDGDHRTVGFLKLASLILSWCMLACRRG